MVTGSSGMKVERFGSKVRGSVVEVAVRWTEEKKVNERRTPFLSYNVAEQWSGPYMASVDFLSLTPRRMKGRDAVRLSRVKSSITMIALSPIS